VDGSSLITHHPSPITHHRHLIKGQAGRAPSCPLPIPSPFGNSAPLLFLGDEG
jgi:hypothetical protein